MTQFYSPRQNRNLDYANTNVIHIMQIQSRCVVCKFALCKFANSQNIYFHFPVRPRAASVRADSRALQRATRRHYSVTVRTNYTAAGTFTRALTVARFRIAYCKIAATTRGRRSELARNRRPTNLADTPYTPWRASYVGIAGT